MEQCKADYNNITYLSDNWLEMWLIGFGLDAGMSYPLGRLGLLVQVCLWPAIRLANYYGIVCWHAEEEVHHLLADVGVQQISKGKCVGYVILYWNE